MIDMVTELGKTMCDDLDFKSLTGLLYIIEAVVACPALVRRDVHSV
jgi:hypothetical protein